MKKLLGMVVLGLFWCTNIFADQAQLFGIKMYEDLFESIDKDSWLREKCINKNYKPTIRFREFADSSINFFIYFQGKSFGDHNTILNAFIKALHKRFKEENIEIPYPVRTVIHKNEIKN